MRQQFSVTLVPEDEAKTGRIGVRLVYRKRDTTFLGRVLCQVWKNDGDTKKQLIAG